LISASWLALIESFSVCIESAETPDVGNFPFCAVAQVVVSPRFQVDLAVEIQMKCLYLVVQPRSIAFG
jgi:hypothetical protein